ncbi:methyltransferase [Sulfobacillus thermotolerans]|uniref:Methyltransferase n=1 Tax=Sulfobacillus thermotolerans TaxID=338644 RepID=A0ABM6RN11_9FIRM|nr:methyltransferase [Sulfobacillus thermotolerans]
MNRRGFVAGSLRLKTGPHRVLEGAPWVYRGEMYHADLTPGTVVELTEVNGRFVGKGFFNPASLIAFRLLTRDVHDVIDGAWFRRRVRDAAQMRQDLLGHKDAYRVVNSEADQLPGLIVDKYGPMLVVEILSLGLVPFTADIVEELVAIFQPQGIYERGDVPVRTKEGLPRTNRMLFGTMVSPVHIIENDVVMLVDLADGQKTGHFLDQYPNRRRTGELAAGRRVFDAFCHTGGFGLTAAKHGAQSVIGIDIDENAVARAQENAAANGLNQVEFLTANAFDWLRKESEKGPQYDLGILDPPAFTKSKDTVAGAIRGYKEINLRGIKLLKPGGILVTSSCSYHMSEAQFIEVVRDAAKDAKRVVKILEIRGQGLDHPMLPGLPESRYLKCLVCYVS